MAIVTGKYLPDDSSLGEPQRILLEMQGGPDSTPKGFNVLGMTKRSRLSKKKMLSF